jgi:hypothetical protein
MPHVCMKDDLKMRWRLRLQDASPTLVGVVVFTGLATRDAYDQAALAQRHVETLQV